MPTALNAESSAVFTILDRVAQLVDAPFAALRRRRQIADTIAALNSCSDAQLKDIGVARADIEKIARRGV